MTTVKAWNDSAIEREQDTPWQRKNRLLQSWYRENALDIPEWGERRSSDRDRVVASMLPLEATARDPGLNFLTEGAHRAVLDRLAIGAAWGGGMLDDDRLKRNMLSSQPLCFNLFGELRLHPEALAEALRASLDPNISRIEDIRIEWAPPRTSTLSLGGGSSFDAFVEFVTSDEKPGFIGFETKYVEDLTKQKPTDRMDVYRRAAAELGQPQLREAVAQPVTSQMAINALLGQKILATKRYAIGCVAMLHCEGDTQPANALGGLIFGDVSFVRLLTYERLIDALDPRLNTWRDAFMTRYLDDAPIHQGVPPATS